MKAARLRQYGGKVLIPMWWGGFSESGNVDDTELTPEVLIPMWWGGFSEENVYP